MQAHDLSPARFFRQPRSLPQQPRVPRAGDAAGAWVHLRAWMRLERRPLPQHGAPAGR